MGKLAKSAMERESVSGSITKGAGGLALVASSGCVCASPSGIARRLLPSLRPSRLHCAAAGLGQPIAVAMAAVCGGGARPGAPARASRALLPAGPIGYAPVPPRPKPHRGFDTRGIRQGCARGRRRSRRGGGGGSRAAPGWAAASRPGEGREGGGQVGRAGRAMRGEPGPLPRERGGPGGAARGTADPRPQLIPPPPASCRSVGAAAVPRVPAGTAHPGPAERGAPAASGAQSPAAGSGHSRRPCATGGRRREEPLGPARGRGRGGGSGGCSVPAARTAQQGAAGAAPARERGGPRAAGRGRPALRAAASNPASCGPGNGPARLCPPRALLGAAAAARTPALQRGGSGGAVGPTSPEPGRRERGRQQRHGCRFTDPSVGAIPPHAHGCGGRAVVCPNEVAPSRGAFPAAGTLRTLSGMSEQRFRRGRGAPVRPGRAGSLCCVGSGRSQPRQSCSAGEGVMAPAVPAGSRYSPLGRQEAGRVPPCSRLPSCLEPRQRL